MDSYLDFFPTTESTHVSVSDIADCAIDLGEYPPSLIAQVRGGGLRRPILLASDDGAPSSYRALVDRHLIPVFQQAALERVPAIVYAAGEIEAAVERMAERFQQVEDPLERGWLCEALRRVADLTVEEMADVLGVGRRTVYRYLDVLALPPLLQIALAQGQLGLTHALACADAVAETLPAVVEEVLRCGLSRRQTEDLVDLAARFPNTPAAELAEALRAKGTLRGEGAADKRASGRAGSAGVDYARYTSRLGGNRRAELENVADRMGLDAVTVRRAALLLLTDPRLAVPSAVAFARRVADTDVGRALALIELGVERMRAASDSLTPNQAKVVALVLHHVHAWADEIVGRLEDLPTAVSSQR